METSRNFRVLSFVKKQKYWRIRLVDTLINDVLYYTFIDCNFFNLCINCNVLLEDHEVL